MKKRLNMLVVVSVISCFSVSTISLALDLPSAPEILTSPRIAFVPAVPQAPVIDGTIGVDEWPSAGQTGNFVLASTLWEPPNDQTNVRLCRDAANLYIAFECIESAVDKIARREDRIVWGNDVAEVFLQPPDGIRGEYWYHIAIDPLGHVWFAREMTIPEMPGHYNIDVQKHNIRCAVKIGKNSWTAEMSIPLTDLHIDSDPWQREWRGNMCRTRAADYINTCWNITQAFQDPGNFGRFIFSNGERAENSATAYRAALKKYQFERQRAIETWQSRKPAYSFKYAYNFGPATGPAQGGYIQVDPASLYSREKGYGWVGTTEGLVAQTIRDLGENRAGTAKDPGTLASSWIYAAGPDVNGRVINRFRVDVPDGEYKVHILSGLLAQERFLPQRRAFSISCNGRELANFDIGHFMYARPFFRCRASRGRLEFTFDGPAQIKPDAATQRLDPDGMKKNFVPGWLVNALVIYPAEDRKPAEEQIARDQMDLLYLPPDDLMKVEYVRQPEEKATAEYTTDEKKRGFIVFQRAMGRRIYPNSRPAREEIRESLHLRVVPGEPAYIAFGLLPLYDLDAMEVTLTDIRGAGATIPASQIRLREAQYRPWMVGGTQYAVEPVFLDDYQYVDHDMNEGECRWFWLSFKTPENLEPGNYHGAVKLASDIRRTLLLQLTLEVMPFRAIDVPFRYGGYYAAGYGKPWPIYMDIFARAFAETGMTTLGLYYKGSGDSFLKDQVRLLVKNGVSGPFSAYSYIPGHLESPLMKGEIKALPDEVINQQIDAARTFLEWMREENFAQLIYTTMDEAHCKGEPYWTEQVRLMAAVKKAVPGILTTATESDRSYWRIKEYIDIPLLFEVEDFRKWRLTPEEIAKGREIWSYPNQAMLAPADINAGRFCTGWLPALTGLRGIVPWEIYGAHDYNESWLKNACWSLFIPRPVGGFRVEPRIVTVMGHIGIWDLRYVETLRSLIAKAESKGSLSARAAASDAKEMLQLIDETTKGSYMYYYKTGYWKPEVFVTLRERVTDGILKLNALLEESK